MLTPIPLVPRQDNKLVEQHSIYQRTQLIPSSRKAKLGLYLQIFKDKSRKDISSGLHYSPEIQKVGESKYTYKQFLLSPSIAYKTKLRI